MTRDVTLNLDEFGRQALSRFAQGGDGSLTKAAEMASLYYLGDRDSGRPAWRVPRFSAAPEPREDFHVEFDDATWEALSREAEAQNVAPETLAVHAVLYLLADVDSGRLAGSLADRLDEIDSSRFTR
jgi:hypothetical protein